MVLNRQTYLVLPLAFDSISRICANVLKSANLMGQRFVRHWLQRLVRATVPPNSVSCRPMSLFLCLQPNCVFVWLDAAPGLASVDLRELSAEEQYL